MQSWMKLLIPDMYKLVCKALGCAGEGTGAQIAAEIELSLQADKGMLRSSFLVYSTCACSQQLL
jgi:hypothetical protein